MANYFKQLNEAFDKKYGLNNVVESKCRKLVETAEADWDWYEDGFTSPLYRLYGQAFEEAGFDEHADVQSGMGEVYISKKGDPEGMFVANFEDGNNFMNRIHTSRLKGKLTDEKRIKEIIFQGVLDISRWRDYPDFENANESFKKSKRKLKEANTDWYSMEWDDQVNAIKRFVKNYRGSKVFEDFAASVGADVDDVIDAFADMESYGVIEIPKEIQIDDKYRNDDIYESKRKLKEAKKAPLTSKPQSISSMLLRNKSAIDNADDLNALIHAVQDAISAKKQDKKAKEILAKLNTMQDHAKALTYIYNIILKGDNLAVSGRKKYEGYDDGNNEIDRYQKWVDFDMSRYGKISERTQQMVNKAGYQIIKDDHGDYEVAAGHFE